MYFGLFVLFAICILLLLKYLNSYGVVKIVSIFLFFIFTAVFFLVVDEIVQKMTGKNYIIIEGSVISFPPRLFFLKRNIVDLQKSDVLIYQNQISFIFEKKLIRIFLDRIIKTELDDLLYAIRIHANCIQKE
jgi:hypothetical protein